MHPKCDNTPSQPYKNKAELYESLIAEVESLIAGESNYIANTANVASAIYFCLNDPANNKLFSTEHKDQIVNWVGFYFVDPETFPSLKQLVLGPFQGRVACIRIPFTRGVCGKCATTEQTIVVPDVHEFPGHIACDSNSNSEIVVPLFNADKKLVGLLDIDSPNLNQFDAEDQAALKKIAQLVSQGCKWFSLG